MFYPRRKFYEDVITVPATATISAAVISSDVLYPFEDTSPGSLTIFVKGDNTKMSVEDMTLTTYVSYDKGDTWVTADETTIANATFTFTTSTVSTFAPRVKFALDLNGATLAEDHGLQIDALFEENSENYRVTTFEDVITMAATVINPASDATTNGTTLTLPENSVAATAVFTADASKLTSEINIRMQSSWDGTNWWDLGSEATDVAALDFKEITSASTDILGDYIRFNLTVDSVAGAIAEDHNISVNLVAFSRS